MEPTLAPRWTAWQGMDMFFAYYLHRLDPVILKLTDAIQLRWYGLAYVAGFMAGYMLLRWWARRGVGVLKEDQVADFITYAAIFGVLIGGRLGYMLFYDFHNFLDDPVSVFKPWKGGMSSHGGVLGLFFFTLYWSRTRKVSWTGLGDNLVVAAPLGLFFGRIANFINGELYGRATNVPWAMQFPEEVSDWQVKGDAHLNAVEELVGNRVPEATTLTDAVKQLARTDDAFAAQLSEILTPRHPSQLYAAALEGLALFAILFYVREKWPRAPHGLLTAIFFIAYAGFRIWDENYREPDRYIAGLTEGQFYSTFMIAVGLAFLGFAIFNARKSRQGGASGAVPPG
jgi:phosphatidylglycerol:prolipoprotein diacylglycerol transferase